MAETAEEYVNLADLAEADKSDLAVTLAALVCQSVGPKGEEGEEATDFSAATLDAVLKASGNKVAPFWSTVFVSLLESG